MNEELKMVYDMIREQMDKALHHMEIELGKVRAGRANPSMVDSVKVDYYGSDSPINQVANVNIPDARTISIQPWEKGMLEKIEKALLSANIGLTPQNNGEMIILNIPTLTEERRKDLVKQIHAIAEESRVGVRTARKHGNDEIKSLRKDGLSEDLAHDAEAEIQKITDQYNKKIEDHLKLKEEELMKV